MGHYASFETKSIPASQLNDTILGHIAGKTGLERDEIKRIIREYVPTYTRGKSKGMLNGELRGQVYRTREFIEGPEV